MVAKTVTPGVTDGLTRIRPDEKSERKEMLALSIEQACDALKKILSSGLNKRAIIVLVQDAVKTNGRGQTIGLGEVETVLEALEGLAAKYCR